MGVATLIFPADVQEEKAVPSPPRMHGSVYSSVGYSRPRVIPQDVRPAPRAADPQRGREGRDARRPGRTRRHGRTRRVRGQARRRRGEGAARPQRPARRPAVRHRADRAPRLARELRNDGGLRHAAHDRHELPVLGMASEGGPGEVRADRPRRPACRDALPGRRSARRRREGDAARVAAAARAQGGAKLARERRGASHRVVACRGGPRDDGGRPDQSAARDLGALPAAARQRDSRRRFRLVHELVGADAEAEAWQRWRRSRGPSRRWGRARRMRSPRSSRTPTGR